MHIAVGQTLMSPSVFLEDGIVGLRHKAQFLRAGRWHGLLGLHLLHHPAEGPAYPAADEEHDQKHHSQHRHRQNRLDAQQQVHAVVLCHALALGGLNQFLRT